MTIKLYSLARWNALPKGQVLELPGTSSERRVRLQINSPGLAMLFFVNSDGEEVFLAAADRRDTVEFAASGNVRITTSSDDVFIYSAELEATSAVIPDPQVFTKIAQRKARNPELEHMMFVMNQNIERRLAAQAAEHQELMAALAAAKPKAAPVEPVAAPVEPVAETGQDEPETGEGGGDEPSA